MKLAHLLIRPGESPWPTAEKHNGVLDHLLSCRWLSPLERLSEPKGYPHSWRVTVDRFVPRDGAKLAADTTWSVFIRPGTVNDLEPVITYRRTEDPRGWTPPDGYTEVIRPGQADFDPVFIDRELSEDAADPPCLVLRDPPPRAKTADDFRLLSDDARPDAFLGADTIDYEVWQCSVILSALPLRPEWFVSVAFPTPKLKRFRCYTVKEYPSFNFGGREGGWRELATLYLLRHPKEPADAALFVRQREFFPLWSIAVQPGANIPSLIEDPTINLTTGLGFADAAIGASNDLATLLADNARKELENELSNLAYAAWWSV